MSYSFFLIYHLLKLIKVFSKFMPLRFVLTYLFTSRYIKENAWDFKSVFRRFNISWEMDNIWFLHESFGLKPDWLEGSKWLQILFIEVIHYISNIHTYLQTREVKIQIDILKVITFLQAEVTFAFFHSVGNFPYQMKNRNIKSRVL